MPRVVTALSGEHAEAQQIAVSLVRLEIPGAELRYHDLDVPLYLNTSTNAVAMAAGAGLVKFFPGPGLQVPQLSIDEDTLTSSVSFTLSNADGSGWNLMAANAYHLAPATIWQGSLALTPGASPFAATFVGAVTVWAGELVHLACTRELATFSLELPDAFAQLLPRRKYNPSGFPRMPVPGAKVLFGTSTVTR